MNPDLDLLKPYPFERLRQLFAGADKPAGQPLNLGMGEPQHAAPAFVLEALADALPQLRSYPATRGLPELRQAVASWLQRRFGLEAVDPEAQVLPVTGTREALFSIAQAVVDRRRDPLVISPNPFYQIYEGAALLAGAQLELLDCEPQRGYLPDYAAVDNDTWQRCQLLYLCNPGNPSGAVTPLETLVQVVELAQEHDFVIAADECYSEIYRDEARPPPGLLQAAQAAGVTDYHNCLVFHSLSKRSNLPGLRSGFVAGDAGLLQRYLAYRTYHGCAMPVHHQIASTAAWSDEAHVRENRGLYNSKFEQVMARLAGTLPLQMPEAGFYLWPDLGVDDEAMALELYRRYNLTTLPGQYLGRDSGNGNPGFGHLRIALVPPVEDCLYAADCLGEVIVNRGRAGAHG